MAWHLLRRFLKVLGGRIMSKMAPRLIIFQYYNRANLELEEQKKKFKIGFHRPLTETLVYKRLANKL
jgi:hypothetical protein